MKEAKERTNAKEIWVKQSERLKKKKKVKRKSVKNVLDGRGVNTYEGKRQA